MHDSRRPEGQSNAATTDRTVSERVIEELAASEGVSPLELGRPLNDSVDPDALDALFAPRYDGAARTGEGFVEFSSHGYRVLVEKNGSVHVDSSAEPSG